MDKEEIFHRFKFHPANTKGRQKAHEAVRSRCAEMAFSFDILLPEGREKTIAMTKLEEVMFWANASIARSRNDQ